MSNHIHLLLKVGKEDLDVILKRIAGSYVYWYNWKYYPAILKTLASQVKGGIIAVCGTNGKTTTNNILNSLLLYPYEYEFRKFFHYGGKRQLFVLQRFFNPVHAFELFCSFI